MSLILAIEPDAAQADAVRRAVRSLPGVDLVLVESRDAALSILKARVPEMILLSALLGPSDEAALTAALRAAPGTGHVEMITIPLLEHGPGFDEGRRGLFGVFGRRKVSNEVRIKSGAFAAELRAHLDRIAETLETHTLTKQRQQRASAAVALEKEAAENLEVVAPAGRDWSGPGDAFGEREFSSDDQGRAIEVVRLSSDVAEAYDAIANRIVRLAAFDRAALGQTLRLENDLMSRRTLLVSERVGGVRLSALLTNAGHRMVVPDLPAALFVMRRLLTTAASVYARTGIAHLAIAPERTVVTPRGEIVIVEAALAAAIEARSYSIDEASSTRDLRQIGLIGLSVMLGRTVPTDADLNVRNALLAEATDVATIRVGEPFANALQAWFDRAMAVDDRASFLDFRDAAAALADIGSSRNAGGVPLRRTLRSFLEEVGAPGGPDDEAIEAARIRIARARQISHRGASAAAETSETFVQQEEPAVEMAAPVEDVEDVEGVEDVQDLQPVVPPEPISVIRPQPLVEEPPPPQADKRNLTLLELFRTARSSDEDSAPMTPSIFADRIYTPVEPAAAESPSHEFASAPESSISEHTGGELAESVLSEVEAPALSDVDGPALSDVEKPVEQFASVLLVEAPAEVEPATEVETPREEVEHAGHFAAEPFEQPVEESAETAHESIETSGLSEGPIVEEPVAPAAEEPEPPRVERRRPSILELFRSSRPRERIREPEADTDTTSILRLHDTIADPAAEAPPEEPPAPEFDVHEPEPVVDEPSSIFTEPIAVEETTPEAESEPAIEAATVPVEPVVEDAPSKVEATAEVAPPDEPVRPRKASLLEFLKSTRFGRSKREPEVAPPAPPPEPEPVVSEVEEPVLGEVERPVLSEVEGSVEHEPLNDIFAELIQAARAVTPASAKRKRKSEAAAFVEPEPIVSEPIEPEPSPGHEEQPEHEEQPVAAEPAVEEDWTTDPVEPAKPRRDRTPTFAEPSTDDPDWADWNAPARASPSEEPPAQVEAPKGEKFRLPDEDEWPTWNELESTTAQPAEDHQVAAPEEPAQLDAAEHEEAAGADVEEEEELQQWNQEPSEPPPPAPPEKSRGPSLLEIFRSARAEESFDAPQTPQRSTIPIEPASGPSVEEVAAQFDAFEASAPDSAPPPLDFPALADVSPPSSIPLEPEEPEPATKHMPPPDPLQSTYAPRPSEFTAPPPTFVPPPPPPQATPPPLGFSPSIAIEPAQRFAPAARPADFSSPPAPAAQTFKGPVTRKSAPTPRRRSWAPVAGATLALACLAIAGRAYYFSAPEQLAAPAEEKPSKPTTVNARGTGSVAISSEPPGARVTIDGKPRGVTPITIANLRPGTHKVILDSNSGTIRRDVKIVAGREVTLDESIYAGWVAVYAPFELQISEGSRVLGTTDNQIMLAPGRHQLELTNRQLGYHESRGIDVTPGETTTVNIKAAEGIVRINAPDGAEVWIDGERVGQTPLGDLRVPVGARDIVVRHPDLGEQHTVANVTIGARAEVTIDFRRPKGD